MRIDITLISGARPLLLSRTLASFQEKLFQHFDVGTCYANIDLFGGGETERDACRDIILQHFPTAQISMPRVPGFGRAVKTVWAQTKAPLVLHLEDDWIARDAIRPEQIEPLFCGATRAVRLLTRHFEWNGRDEFLIGTRKDRLLGIVYRRTKFNAFGTSPGFFDGAFMRSCADLINPDLDPEKQMRKKYNPVLSSYMDQFRCGVLPGQNRGALLVDIGREWRDEKGLVKVVSRGRSVWTVKRRSIFWPRKRSGFGLWPRQNVPGGI
jgi:hypothetical protein